MARQQATIADDVNKLMSLRDAGKSLAVPLCYATLFKWMTFGIKVHGVRVVLKTRRVGRQSFTCAAWLAEFQSKVDAASKLRVKRHIPGRLCTFPEAK